MCKDLMAWEVNYSREMVGLIRIKEILQINKRGVIDAPTGDLTNHALYVGDGLRRNLIELEGPGRR
jgi:hypothetical protein